VFTWGNDSYYKHKNVPYCVDHIDRVDRDDVFCEHAYCRGREHFNGKTPISSACTSRNIVVVTAEGGVRYTGPCFCYTLGLRHVFNYDMTQIPPHVFGDTKIT